MEIILTVIGVVVFVAVMMAMANNESTKQNISKIADAMQSIEGFQSTQQHISPNGSIAISIDESNCKVCLIDNISSSSVTSSNVLEQKFVDFAEKHAFTQKNKMKYVAEIRRSYGVDLRTALDDFVRWQATNLLYFSRNGVPPFGGSDRSPLILDYHDILATEIMEDGAPVTSTATARTNGIGRALIGGALFGGVGAIVGASTSGSSSSSRTIKEVNSIDVKIVVNNTKRPVWIINFLNMKTTKGSLIYRPAIERAQHWQGLLSVIIHQADTNSM